MAQTFQKHIVVSQNDLDQLDHVNNVRYVQWVQDIAEAHWNSKKSKTLEDSYFWVMLKHCIAYKTPAILGDVLRLTTFVKSTEGVTSTRIVEIFNETKNTLVVTSETQWCLISRSNNKPTRIPKKIVELFN